VHRGKGLRGGGWGLRSREMFMFVGEESLESIGKKGSGEWRTRLEAFGETERILCLWGAAHFGEGADFKGKGRHDTVGLVNRRKWKIGGAMLG